LLQLHTFVTSTADRVSR